MRGNMRGMPSTMRAEYLTDPRMAMAQQLAQQGTATTPVGSPLEALSRALQGGIAGYQQKKLQDEYLQRGTEANKTMADALALGSGMPEQPNMPGPSADGSAGYTMPAQPGNRQAMLDALMANPDTADMATTMIGEDMKGKNAMNYKLQEVYDPNSPTGTKFVSEAEAMGQPGKPSKGQKISVGADGQVTIEDGYNIGGIGGSSLTTSNQTKVQEKAINTAENMARIRGIEEKFDPRFLTLGSKAGMRITGMKDFVGVKLEPAEAKDLEDFTKFKQDTTANLNMGIKEATGATMGEKEADRIISTMPNVGQGMFDGDSPTVFKAKLDNTITQLKAANIRANWALNNSTDPLKTGVELSDVPKLIDTEGAKIEQQVRQQFPQATDEQIDAETNIRLGKLFGM